MWLSKLRHRRPAFQNKVGKNENDNAQATPVEQHCRQVFGDGPAKRADAHHESQSRSGRGRGLV